MAQPAFSRLLQRAAACVLLAAAPAAAAQVASEADLRAAVVFNFAQFTRWPAETPPSQEPFTLCYSGDDFGRALGQLATRTIHERPLLARRVPAEGPYTGCRMMYWGDGRAPRLVSAPPGAALLTVGSGGDFLQRGGMIQIQVENSRLVFSVNVDAARSAGLQISSKLLRLARSVQGNVE